MKPVSIVDVRVDDERIAFGLSDGREIAIPTSWSPRLVRASATQRGQWLVDPTGIMVEWPDIDEDIGLWTALGVSEEEVMEAAGWEVQQSGTRP